VSAKKKTSSAPKKKKKAAAKAPMAKKPAARADFGAPVDTFFAKQSAAFNRPRMPFRFIAHIVAGAVVVVLGPTAASGAAGIFNPFVV